MLNRFRILAALTAFTATMLTASHAPAFFHLWRFTEFFSNLDGSVQFIELESSGSSETLANGAEFRSQSTGKVVTLTQNLSGSTLNKRLLLATAGFGDLPGGVAPDFPAIPLPAGFFNPDGDIVTLFHHQLIDQRQFTSVPTDGVASRNYPTDTLATNSPTNFAGASGSVNVPLLAGDYNDNGVVDAADFVVWRENLNTINLIPNDTTPHWVMEEDYPVWRQNFGDTGSGAGSIASLSSVVPEPSAGLGLLVGTAALAFRRRR